MFVCYKYNILARLCKIGNVYLHVVLLWAAAIFLNISAPVSEVLRKNQQVPDIVDHANISSFTIFYICLYT